LKTREDVLSFISSVLFSVALIVALPASLNAALLFGRRGHLEFETLGQLGLVSLAVIGIGLVLCWTQYIKKIKSAWFLLLLILCGWTFPVFVLPHLIHANPDLTNAAWFWLAIHNAVARHALMQSTFMVLLMVTGLALPFKSIFWR